MSDSLKIIYATFETLEEAKSISRSLVSEHLVACANILPEVTSIFRWEGKVGEEPEVAVLFKTRAGKAGQAVEKIKELHSYDTPGIEIWDVEDAPEGFKEWVLSETG